MENGFLNFLHSHNTNNSINFKVFFSCDEFIRICWTFWVLFNSFCWCFNSIKFLFKFCGKRLLATTHGLHLLMTSLGVGLGKYRPDMDRWGGLRLIEKKAFLVYLQQIFFWKLYQRTWPSCTHTLYITP